jgi:signal transduction histidine kinase
MKDLVLSENFEQLNHSIQLVNHYDSLINCAFGIVNEKFLGDKSIVEEAYNTCKDWTIIRNEVIKLTREGNYAEAIKITKGKGAVHVKLVFEKTKLLTDFAQNKADELYQNTIKTRRNSIVIIITIAFILLLLSALTSYIISKSISEPIRKFIIEINQIFNKKAIQETKFIRKSEEQILSYTVLELKAAYQELENLKIGLEQKVEKRTKELKEQNEEYASLNEEYLIINEELLCAKENLEENEAKLIESNKTKDKFFSIIAHDLRSPFTSLLGISDLLLKNHKVYEADERDKFIKLINNSAKNTYNLLSNLLTWSCSQQNRIEYLPEIINIEMICNEVISLLSQLSIDKSISLSNKIDTSIFVNADKNMIKIILSNLITNAIKFTNKKGSIIVSAKEIEKDNCIEISISDTGIGIPNDRINDLFRIDKNASTLGTEKEKGTGLGLILCKEFVEKNNGKISVESVVNKGSKFSFTLPKEA